MNEEQWKQITYFKPKEFKCHCGQCGSTGNEMNFDMVKTLDFIRELIEEPIFVTSGYRCLAYQEKVNPGVLGAHPLGRAADIMFKTNDYFLRLIYSIAVINDSTYFITNVRNNISLPIKGIGIYPSKAFIHIDNVQHLEKVVYKDGTEKVFKRPDLCIWGA